MSGDVMRRRTRRRHAAGALGLFGGSMGVVAGLVQLTVGARIPDWTGDKASPVALGSLTVLLSGISLVCAIRLRHATPLPPGRQVTVTAGLLLPGLLCFSTTGTLWYLPGVLLVLAGVWAIAASDIRQTREVIEANWPSVLISALGGIELLMAVSAAPVTTMVIGVIGGLALVAAPWTSPARLRVGLLLVGALPFAVLTWWSLASPLLALLALAIGLPTLRSRSAGAEPRGARA